MMKLKLYAFALMASAAFAANANLVTDEGAWCWFADPRAIHYEDQATGIDASYLGYIDVHGNIKAMQYDFAAKQSTEVLVRSYFQPDDHNNPTFLVLPDKRVLIIYSRHTDEPAFYYRISQKPGDITTLGAEHKIVTKNNTTYPSPFIMADDPNHVYLCWRGIGWHPTIGRLTMPDANDNMDFDWGPYQMVQSTGARPYAKYYSNGKDKIYVTYTTGHPDNEQPNWVYFNVININGGNSPILEDIKGNKLSTIANGTFAVNKSDSYKSSYPNTVVDATSGIRDWVWQTTLDADANPVIAMVKISGDKNTHDYYYAKWTGSQWRVTFLANGGGKFHPSNTEYCYSGGMAIDPDNAKDLYLSIPTTGANGKVYEIWKYTVDNDGKVTAKEQVTKDSEKNNVRPYVLPGSKDSDMRLGWMNGDYQYWIVKKDFPLGFPTAIRTNADWTETLRTIASVKEEKFGAGLALTTAAPQAVALDSKPAAFTVNVSLAISADNYQGTLLDLGGAVCGLDKNTSLPYVEIGGTRYNSSNKLLTSDLWATNSSGTSGDNWPTKFGKFNLTVTYDGTNFCTYRDGLLDQKIEAKNLAITKLAVGPCDATLYSVAVYPEAMTFAEVKNMLQTISLQDLTLPEVVYTDLVLSSDAKWVSSNPQIIANNGTFTAPEAATDVTLKATVGSAEREFTVKAMPRDIEHNIIAGFTFDALKGSDKVADVTGNGNDMTIYGSALVENGALDLTANTAAGFSTNGYAILPPAILDGLRSYTVLVTVKANSLTKAPRIYDFGYNSGNSVFLRASALSAGIKYAGGTTTMVNSGTQLTTGKTYNLAVTFDARNHTTSIYIDGQLASAGQDNVNEAYMIAADAVCNRNYVGRTQWWDNSGVAKDNVDFCGTIDNLYIYNTALTLVEIMELQGYVADDPAKNVDYTSALANPDFEGEYSVMQNSGVTSDRAIYIPAQWTLVYVDGNENDITALNAQCLAANNLTSIAANPKGGKNTYMVRQKWGASSIGFYQAVDTLPAAIYRIEADVWQNGLGGNATVYVQGAEKTAGGVGENKAEWQTAHAQGMCDGKESLRFGFTAMHNDNGSEKLLGFDNFKLYDVTANASAAELYALIGHIMTAARQAAADSNTPADIAAELNDAVGQGEAFTVESGREEMMPAYQALRQAMIDLRNGKVSDGIDAIQASAEEDSPVFDLTGRQVLPSSAGLSDLPAGVYLQKGKKHIIR